jgi:hypothetical protein
MKYRGLTVQFQRGTPTTVYVEGPTADGKPPGYVARVDGLWRAALYTRGADVDSGTRRNVGEGFGFRSWAAMALVDAAAKAGYLAAMKLEEAAA